MSSRQGAMSIILIGFLVTFFTGCGPRGPIATPTPTKTPQPLVTPAAPTNTPTPTPTPKSDRCPLTGEAMEEPEKALRRPLIVKIGNDKRSRPQSGLHKADIVIEHLAEGGITRLDAVYLCQDFEKIGPVRSARLIDIPLAYLFDGIFAHAGASGGVLWVLNNETNFPRLDETTASPCTLGICEDREFPKPYNLFTSTSALWQISREQGWQRPMLAASLLFGPLDPATPKEERDEIVIPYFRDNRVGWRWDPDTQRNLRSLNEAPSIEATSGEQISAANVIILWAEHKETDIIEDEYNYVHSVDIKLKGEGKALIFRNGYLIPARWIWEGWAGTGNMLSFFDEAGTPVPLAEGNSWIEVVPPWLEIETE